MNMTAISKCNMHTCAYNEDGSCHTLGITVGPHAECNTYVHASSHGGFADHGRDRSLSDLKLQIQ